MTLKFTCIKIHETICTIQEIQLLAILCDMLGISEKLSKQTSIHSKQNQNKTICVTS